jgi:outer membrane murein-binding lipoprotein Lpp
LIVILSSLLVLPAVCAAQESDLAGEVRELRAKLERLEKKMADEEAQKAKKAEVERVAITEQVKKDVMTDVAAKSQSYFSKLIEQTKIGSYGSMRYGTSNLDDLHNTFTFRRFVMTVDSPIYERLKAYMELEFERFTSLELDKKLTRTSGGGLTSEVAIEGTHNSEISMEQAWMQYDITDWLKFRGGAVLVPLGRFNIDHDDNRWDLPRRSLVDKGTPVLPTTAAWPELGVGFLGDIPIGNTGKLSYQAYVMNGVTLNSEIEQIGQTRAGDTTKLAYEVKLQPNRGTFADDVKKGKAIGTRWAYSPGSAMKSALRFIGDATLPTFSRISPCFPLPLTAKKLGGHLKSRDSM